MRELVKSLVVIDGALILFWALFSCGLFYIGQLDHPTFYQNWKVINVFFGAVIIASNLFLVAWRKLVD